MKPQIPRGSSQAEKSEPAGACQSPSSSTQPPCQRSSTHPPAPTIYTQAPQIVRRTPSLMLSLSPTLDDSTTMTTTMASSGCFGTGHSSAGSFHQHQHQHHQHQHHQHSQQSQQQLASGGTTSATHAIPSSKHFQFAGEAAASSSATLSPYSTTTPNGGGPTSPAGGSTGSSATVKKKSSFMKRKKPLPTRSEVSPAAPPEAEAPVKGQ